MIILKNILATTSFFLLINGISAQQAVSNNEQIGNNEVTNLKKVNPNIEKVEKTIPSNTPTWERSKNPNMKQEEVALKEESMITELKSKNPKK